MTVALAVPLVARRPVTLKLAVAGSVPAPLPAFVAANAKVTVALALAVPRAARRPDALRLAVALSVAAAVAPFAPAAASVAAAETAALPSPVFAPAAANVAAAESDPEPVEACASHSERSPSIGYSGQSISAQVIPTMPVTAAPATLKPTPRTVPGGTMIEPSVSSTIDPAPVSDAAPAWRGSA